MRLATVTQNWNSTVRHQELQVISGAESTNEIARVLAAAPASTDYGLVVRSVPTVPTVFATIANSTVGNSTDTTIISSAATVPYVSAYTVTSSEAGPIQCGFFKGSTLLWPLTMWANGGMNTALAVSPPGFVFKGAVNRPINFKITSGSTGTIRVGVTYRQE